MYCDKCHKKKERGVEHSCNAPKVIQIDSAPEIVTFHTVVITADMGDEESIPPVSGRYANTVVQYEASGNVYLYNSDRIPVRLTPEQARDFNRLTNRPKYAGVEMDSTTDIPSVTAVSDALAEETAARVAKDAELEEVLDTNVVTDIAVSTDASTSVVQLDASKVNLKTSVTSTSNVPLPVASDTQAGVMNAATFNAVAENAANIEALTNGAVALTGISASPTQQELTTAWETETGATALMNRASIYDVDNDKVWTYYSNTSTWYPSANTPSIVINTFTNTSEGTIKGSTNVGQVFAESDGTGSVNGWDSLTARTSDLESDVATKLSYSNLSATDGLTATTSGTGTNTSIALGISNAGIDSGKIDFSSLKSSAFPATTTTVQLGYSFSATITRVANLVIVSNPSSIGTNLYDCAYGNPLPLSEKIPAGFRPTSAQRGVIHGVYRDATDTPTGFHSGVSWTVDTGGGMSLLYRTNVAGTHNINASILGVWFTNDPWPEA